MILFWKILYLTKIYEMRDRRYWVMDYETIVNCFVAVFIDLNSSSLKTFVINRNVNDLPKLLKFFKENIENNDWHFGYNNLAFDAQLTEFILQNQRELLELDTDDLTATLSNYANYVIERSSAGEFLDYPEFKLSIRCVDIFKLNHWDNAAKRSSLKWIQYSMDWFNVEEMPHHHSEPVLTDSQLEDIVNYCINDVKSTKNIFLTTDQKGERVMISQINLRAKLSAEYEVNLFSASEPRISKEIFLYFLSKKLNIPKKEIRNLRTFRDNVNIKNIILPSISFENT